MKRKDQKINMGGKKTNFWSFLLHYLLSQAGIKMFFTVSQFNLEQQLLNWILVMGEWRLEILNTFAISEDFMHK